MPHIEAVGTALPPHVVDQEAAKDFARRLFEHKIRGLERLLTVFEHAAVERRHFAVPLPWFEEDHSLEEKNALYIAESCRLGEEAIYNCLHQASIQSAQIDHFILVTSTGVATPSLDAHLINQLPFREDVKRTPLWGLGCVGGAVGLTRALEYASTQSQKSVLLLCVELCGLTFQRSNFSKSNLVATALFGDGAAAVLVTGDGGGRGQSFALDKQSQGEEGRARGLRPYWLDSYSFTWRGSLDVMGWSLSSRGLDVIFSRDIPTLVRSRLRQQVEGFLQRQGLILSQIQHFIAHPGGIKVLQAYAEALQVPWENFRTSLSVLQNCGNMSSPSVLFVLERLMRESVGEENACHSGDYSLLFALGPGFSLELVLLQWREVTG